MIFKKKNALILVPVIAILCIGTTAFAANALNIGSTNDNCVVLGLDGEKETDGTSKVSFDMGETWISQNEVMYSDDLSTEYWTYEEYKTYAETIEKDLMEMLAAGEPDLTMDDIRTWQEEAAQNLSLIEAGGKIAKNAIGEDCQIMISDSSNATSITEQK